jgi:hypothetical protein
VPSFTALAEEVTADMILDRLIGAVPVPRFAHEALIARQEAADRGSLVVGGSDREAASPDFRRSVAPASDIDDDRFGAREEVSA